VQQFLVSAWSLWPSCEAHIPLFSVNKTHWRTNTTTFQSHALTPKRDYDSSSGTQSHRHPNNRTFLLNLELGPRTLSTHIWSTVSWPCHVMLVAQLLATVTTKRQWLLSRKDKTLWSRKKLTRLSANCLANRNLLEFLKSEQNRFGQIRICSTRISVSNLFCSDFCDRFDFRQLRQARIKFNYQNCGYLIYYHRITSTYAHVDWLHL